jgi:hypothetical protein
VLQDLLHHVLRHVDGDGEADPLVPAGAARRDGGIDADQLALRVQERTAGVTGVNGGVGLDEVFAIFYVQTIAPGSADDSLVAVSPTPKGLPMAKA